MRIYDAAEECPTEDAFQSIKQAKTELETGIVGKNIDQ
jgi:hypothetical protein